MPSSRGSRAPAPRYDPNSPSAVGEQLRMKESLQKANAQSQNDAAARAVGRAVPQYALPAGGAGGTPGTRKSVADQDAIDRSVKAFQAGNHMAPNTPRMPSPPNNQAGSPLDLSQHLPPGMPETHSHPMPSKADIAPLPSNSKAGDAVNLARNQALYAPHDAPANAPAAKAGPVYAGAGNNAPFRGSTAEEIAQFRATDPNAAANAATAAAAGTGKNVVTPYGTASSRTAAPTEATVAALNAPASPIKDANGTQTGVGRPGPATIPWQNQVLAAHPEIGVAGSPQNKAFVAAYKGGHVQPGKELDFSHTLYPTAGQGAAAGAQGSLAGVHANPAQATPQGPPAPVATSAPPFKGNSGDVSGLSQTVAAIGNAAVNRIGQSVFPTPAATPQYTPSPVVGVAAAAPASSSNLAAAKAYANLYDQHVGPAFRAAVGVPSGAGPQATPSGSPDAYAGTSAPQYPNPAEAPTTQPAPADTVKPSVAGGF